VLASDHGGRDFHQWELNLAAPDARVEKSVDFSTKISPFLFRMLMKRAVASPIFCFSHQDE